MNDYLRTQLERASVFHFNTAKNMNPQATTVREWPATGTYGDMPFPVTLLNVPKITTATQITLPLVRINAIEHLEDEFASVDEGKKIYPLLKQALEQGRKVRLSVKGLDLDGHFFDGAICTLYGDFSADFVDSHIEVVDVLDEDIATLRDMREMRKYYYYDRAFYDEIVNDIDPILGYNDGFIRDNEITCEADMDFNYKLENK
jgi:hypothetical protein